MSGTAASLSSSGKPANCQRAASMCRPSNDMQRRKFFYLVDLKDLVQYASKSRHHITFCVLWNKAKPTVFQLLYRRRAPLIHHETASSVFGNHWVGLKDDHAL